jgi:GTP-binding protein
MTARREGPAVVLVGRPNVGKSTLFNRITGTRRSIVAPVAGTTRDTLAAAAEWRDRRFTLVDTGGLFGATSDPLHELVVAHGLTPTLIRRLVVDGREGMVPADQEIAARLHALGVPVLVAVNKTDDRRARSRAMEFFRMGFEPVIEIAAEHGDGVADLLDEVATRLPATGGERALPEPETAVAIVGRTSASPRSSIGCLGKNVSWSTRCRARPAIRWTCCSIGTNAASGSWIRPACGDRAGWPAPGRSKA